MNRMGLLIGLALCGLMLSAWPQTNKIPVIGALMIWARAAYYLDRLFKGTKPQNLPIEQEARLKLVVNQKTAKALGIKIPQSILLRANEVIQ